MADGLMLPPGAGRRIRGAGMTLKVGAEQSGKWSAFEAEVAPGFDVGAHRHAEAEEIFYFTNPGTAPARMLFLVTPSGHEQYLEGIAELLGRPGPPDQAAIVELRARYDIEQLTSMIPDRRRATSH
jgi:hypothetical protein